MYPLSSYVLYQPLDEWDVRKVEDMTQMFCFGTALNQPSANGKTKNLQQIQGIFRGASFNQSISCTIDLINNGTSFKFYKHFFRNSIFYEKIETTKFISTELFICAEWHYKGTFFDDSIEMGHIRMNGIGI
jgi:hypothetical protein